MFDVILIRVVFDAFFKRGVAELHDYANLALVSAFWIGDVEIVIFKYLK